MKIGWMVASAVLAATAQAHAATIFEQSGTLSQLDAYFDVNRVLFSVGGRGSFAPTFATPPIFSGPNSLADPWVYDQNTRYTVTLTTGIPLIQALWQTYHAWYYNEYAVLGGQWTYIGGDDNNGGRTDYQQVSCEINPSCSQANMAANVASFSFISEDSASWGSVAHPFEYWSWTNGFQFVGDVPADIETLPGILNTPYTLEISADAVPEPSTWAMLILGIFGIGCFLRRQRPQHVPPL